MKWPKEWVEVIAKHLRGLQEYYESPNLGILHKPCKPTLNHAQGAINALDDLCKLGALKEPPRPLEIWWCKKCVAQVKGDGFDYSYIHKNCREPLTLMREVTND